MVTLKIAEAEGTGEFFQELNALVAQEAKKVQLEELQETDWTIQRVMDQYSLSINQARRLLNNLAEQGHCFKVKTPNPNGGGARIAYRPIQK